MKVTINVPQQVVAFGGAAHYLSRAGVNRLLSWLFRNAEMLWGWAESGEYVFQINEGANHE